MDWLEIKTLQNQKRRREMSDIVRFVTTKYVLDRTPIDKDLDQDIFKSVIYQQQETKTQAILGTCLYKVLKGHVKEYLDNSTPIPAAYSTLLYDYVRPSLVQWSYWSAILHYHNRVTDKGVINQNDNSAQQAGRASMKDLRQEVRDRAEFFDKLMHNYLEENEDSFPEYSQCCDEGVKPQKKPYFSGIQLGK